MEIRHFGASAAKAVELGCIVEASAGTGKTTRLVERIADCIAAGTAVNTIVAVTFTHAAAGNMKLRVRQELQHRYAAELDLAVRERLNEASRTLDRAFIGTIHSFCAQLLRRRPIEAQVDPAFSEISQSEALQLFNRIFRRWVEHRLSSPSPALRRAMTRLARFEDEDGSEPLDLLRAAAWNLSEWREYPAPWSRRPFDQSGELETLLGTATSLRALRDQCDRRYDSLHSGLMPLANLLDRVDRSKAAGNWDLDLIETDILRLPNEMRWLKAGSGPYGNGISRETVFQGWNDLKAAIETFKIRADADLAVALRDELWEVVALYEHVKRRSGQLDFMDLLLCARRLLKSDHARADLQKQYTRIFVDEFQDTDELQAEILFLLAAADPSERNWRRAIPVPGKLFLVGDPKQSIYRFRRADAKLYRRIRADLESHGFQAEQLTSSTRSIAPIQAFVNAAFSNMPGYSPLTDGPQGLTTQPGIIALPMPEPYGTQNLSMARIDECSPKAVAGFIEWLKKSEWQVRDPGSGQLRPIMYDDVCILFRRFSNRGIDLTQEYVRCLEARLIPHVLVGSKSFHHREEVGVLRTALAAIEWTDDEMSVFATLKGGLFSFPDSTLLRFQREVGRFDPYSKIPDGLDAELSPVADALNLLADLHRRRNYRPIAETISELLEQTRAHVGFAFRKGGERVLANVYRLTDLARSFETGEGGHSFRAFVEFLEIEYEHRETSEAPLLEQQREGVQLMTVHKAKGLEFPIVILADLTAKLTGPEGGDRYVDSEAEPPLCAQRLCWWRPWDLLEHSADEAAAEREEAERVAYVAATRARDLLVVSAVGEKQFEDRWLSPLYDALYPLADRWRIAGTAPGCPVTGTSTVLNRPPDHREDTSIRPGLHLPKRGTHEVVWFDPRALPPSPQGRDGLEHEDVLSGTPDQAVAGMNRYLTWKQNRSASLERGGTPAFRVISARSVAEMPDARHIKIETVTLPIDLPRPAGRTFGTLVHELLRYAEQVGEIPGLGATYGRKHGASKIEIDAAVRIAEAAFAHPALAWAATAKRYRELPIVVRDSDGRLIEGNIDLAISDGQSWTVVDYKTDRRTNRNPAQLQAYGLALERATGLPVRGVLLEI